MVQYWNILLSFPLIALFMSSIREVSSINCFQCNSLVDYDCPYVQPNDTRSIYYKPCVGDFKGKMPFCRKIEQKIFDRDDMVRVVRKCGWEKHDRLDCYKNSNDDHSEIVCQCFHDACNGATVTSSFNVVSAVCIAVAIWYQRSFLTARTSICS